MLDIITTGEILQDRRKNGKETPWKENKERSTEVSESFARLGYEKRAERVGKCSEFLEYEECKKDNYKKLVQANFCKDRLCPACNGRRSIMMFAQIMQILHAAQTRKRMRYVFLTLTVRNCKGEELSETIDKIFEGYNRLFKYKRVDKPIIGWVRCLEVTRNNDKKSKEYDTFHPHFHVLLGVEPSYFSGGKDGGYISQKDWSKLWQKALQADYAPRVDVRAVKPKREGQTVEAATAETAKYSVKATDYIHDDDDETDKVIDVLAKALRGRRLIGYGKLFKQLKAELKLKDVESENADLVGADKGTCTCPICGGALEQALYQWHLGYHNYFRRD